jgi:hypothetical protein
MKILIMKILKSQAVDSVNKNIEERQFGSPGIYTISIRVKRGIFVLYKKMQ